MTNNHSYNEIAPVWADYKAGMSVANIQAKYGIGKTSAISIRHEMAWFDGLQEDDVGILFKYGLRKKAIHAIKRFGGIKKITEAIYAIRSAPGELLSIRNFGTESLDELRDAVSRYLTENGHSIEIYPEDDVILIDMEIQVLRDKITRLEQRRDAILREKQPT